MTRLFVIIFLTVNSLELYSQVYAYTSSHNKIKYEAVYSVITLIKDSSVKLPSQTSSTQFGTVAAALTGSAIKVGLNFLDTYKKKDLTKYSSQHITHTLNSLPKNQEIPGIKYQQIGIRNNKEEILLELIIHPIKYTIAGSDKNFYTFNIISVDYGKSLAKTTTKNPFVDLIIDIKLGFLGEDGKLKEISASDITMKYISANGVQDILNSRNILQTSPIKRDGYIHTVSIKVSEKNSYKISDGYWFGGLSSQADAVESLINAIGGLSSDEETGTQESNPK